MIYEWYSGSDDTKHVPRELVRLKHEGETFAGDPTIATLRDLLQVEREPNWRGYLLWRIGRELLRTNRDKEGMRVLLEAEREFDPMLPSIRDMVAGYCDTLFTLIVGYYFPRDEFAKIATLAMSLIAYLPDSQLADAELGAVFFYQGFALEMLAKRHSLEFLHPLALASYLKWHRLEPEDPACLEHLAYSYFYTGDMARSGMSARMCLEVAPKGEIRDRIDAFLREHADKLGGDAGGGH